VTISSFYDPLVSKLSVWAPTRALAIARMRRALSEYVVTGIRTNLVFHEKLFAQPEFCAGKYDTGFIERHKEALLGYTAVPEVDRDGERFAVALAASRIELSAGQKTAQESAGEGLSPWVQEHRRTRA
jgi:acetyl-CoA carboxylase biotin carboxylase subunit